MKYRRIGVFLSARPDLPECFVTAARDVGGLIGRTGRTLVYGGSDRGLMGVLAESAKRSGGRVYGVVPDILFQRGWVSDCIDVTFRCADLTDRKAILCRESEAFLVLPGGIGTLDEAFTVMGQAAIGLDHKPVIFYNVDGCWDSLLHTLGGLFSRKLIPGSPGDFYQVADSLAQLESLL